MDENRFFIEIQELLNQIEDLVDNYNCRDRYVSVVLCGLLEPGSMESGYLNIKALYNYNIKDREELEDVQDFVSLTYEEDDIDLEDFLLDLGIELE
jgi:hypothetical protein|tara:strand:+ start:5421 stop:5708 length:288 start_codon:yes stop_codon:yes gene_type:complete